MTGGGAFRLGSGVNDNRGTIDNTFTGADDFSWTHGRHSIRFGGELSRYQLNCFNNFAQRVSVTFANAAAGAGGVSVPLTGFQNFLLGRVTTTQGGSGFSRFYFRATNPSLYVQDDWKATQRLTLNFGLRWEGISIANEKNNFLSNFAGLGDGDPGPIHIIHPEDTPRAGTPGVSSCTLEDCFKWKNFGPRFGFAWDVMGDGSTAIRGGYGIYYNTFSPKAAGLSADTGPSTEHCPLRLSRLLTFHPFWIPVVETLAYLFSEQQRLDVGNSKFEVNNLEP